MLSNFFSIFQTGLLVLFLLFISQVHAHGRLLNPPARSSAWRFDSRFPIEYNDNEMFCGGFNKQWTKNGGKCGICGEDYSALKKWEKGGSMYRGHRVRTYEKGQNIEVFVQITANHAGWVEFRICNIDGLNTDATQECLDKNLLKDADGNTRFNIPWTLFELKKVLVLPKDLVCDHCVIQWKYNAGNNWGKDQKTGKGCIGCGAQEQFYGCSDVSIVNNLVPATSIKPTVKTTIHQPNIKPNNGLMKKSEAVLKINPCFVGDGWYVDVSSGCSQYYKCQALGTKLKILKFTCEAGKSFDEKFGTCIDTKIAKC